MASDYSYFDITLHRMLCSKGDFSSLYNISHINGQIVATFKRVSHHERGTEIFIKNLLPDVFLQEILDFVFPMGQIYQIRILLEYSGHCRGYCYVSFFEVESARKALMLLSGKAIRNKPVVVKMSFDNNKLEIHNIPKGYSITQMYREVSDNIGNGLQDLFFVKPNEPVNSNNYNSCILVYDTHKDALKARVHSFNGLKLFGMQFRVEWAVAEEKMRSKRLYFEAKFMRQLNKADFYEEIIKYVDPKTILNIFLQHGIGYVTFENESVAYDAFKAFKNFNLFGNHLQFSFRRFYKRLPKLHIPPTAANCTFNQICGVLVLLGSDRNNGIDDFFLKIESKKFGDMNAYADIPSRSNGVWPMTIDDTSPQMSEATNMTTSFNNFNEIKPKMEDKPVFPFKEELYCQGPQICSIYNNVPDSAEAFNIFDLCRICGTPHQYSDAWLSMYHQSLEGVPIKNIEMTNEK